MKTARAKPAARSASSPEFAKLRARVAVAEDALRAIRTGEVDAVVVAGKLGRQVFTLEGAESAYRVLIESMNEGALTLTVDKTILFANQCFARMVKCPLEQVTGSSFRRFLSVADQATLRPLMKQSFKTGSKMQVLLHATDGSLLPVQISVSELARDSSNELTIGMVVTDLTESRRAEELLRALTHRVVQVQEAERSRVALELHDNITQPLIAVLFSSQALVGKLPARNGSAKTEAIKLRELLGVAAAEVERISRNLRPGVLDQLGLVEVLRSTSTEFAKRTGVAVAVDCTPLPAPLPAQTELALYRILQEALKNVEQHARAKRVSVRLGQADGFVQLAIDDDGVGIGSEHRPTGPKGSGSLGLVSMRERAAYVGGTLQVKTGLRAGTEIVVRVPLAPSAAAA